MLGGSSCFHNSKVKKIADLNPVAIGSMESANRKPSLGIWN